MEYRVNTKGLMLPNDETHVDWFLLAIAERLERIAELMEQARPQYTPLNEAQINEIIDHYGIKP